MISNVDELVKLDEKFTSADVEWRIGVTKKDKSQGMALPYITNRAIQQRLDQVVGKGYWKNKYIPWHNGSQLCELSIKVVYEDGSFEWIEKVDGAECSDIESIKGGLSDSMKRAAVQWGIGRYLYELPTIWVELNEGKFIPEHEKRRLNAFVDGDPSAKYKNWHDKNGKSLGNSGTCNSYNTKQRTQNQQKTHNSESKVNAMNTTQTNVRSNANTSNTRNKSNAGNIGNLASPGQINYIKGLMRRVKTDEATVLSEYKVEAINDLTISQANTLIKKLSAIVA